MLHHESFGDSGLPHVLFLHGFMGSADDWEAVIASLLAEFHCLAVDLPGHGGSVGVDDTWYTMEGAARALVALLDARGIAACTVVGYSMGGRLALYLAMAYPERCSRLVLESASPGLETAAKRAARRQVDASRAARLEQGDFEAFLNEWYRQPLFTSLSRKAGRVEAMVARRLRNDPRALARVLRGMGTGRQPSLWERLAAWRVSTLAVAGSLDAKYVAIARRMAAASRAVETAIVPEAGHNVHAEQPAPFGRLLHAFLKSA